jgi:hypothetical protein
MSQQVMSLPTQNVFTAKQLAEWEMLFESNQFVPTGEEADRYQGHPDQADTCAWRTIPRGDLLSLIFLYLSRWYATYDWYPWRTPQHDTEQALPKPPAHVRYGRLVALMDTLSCLFVSALLAVTVKVLAVVRPLNVRIAVIAALGTLFALLLKLMAGNPTRGEVFGATAAFYAVLYKWRFCMFLKTLWCSGMKVDWRRRARHWCVRR